MAIVIKTLQGGPARVHLEILSLSVLDSETEWLNEITPGPWRLGRSRSQHAESGGAADVAKKEAV